METLAVFHNLLSTFSITELSEPFSIQNIFFSFIIILHAQVVMEEVLLDLHPYRELNAEKCAKGLKLNERRWRKYVKLDSYVVTIPTSRSGLLSGKRSKKWTHLSTTLCVWIYWIKLWNWFFFLFSSFPLICCISFSLKCVNIFWRESWRL